MPCCFGESALLSRHSPIGKAWNLYDAVRAVFGVTFSAGPVLAFLHPSHESVL